jgi:hypothetical protein
MTIQVHCHILQQHYVDAIQLGNKVLQKLGEGPLNIQTTTVSSTVTVSTLGGSQNITTTSSNDAVLKSMSRLLDGVVKSNNNVNGNSCNYNARTMAASIVESLAPMTDPKNVQAMELYNLLLSPAFAEQGHLISCISSRMVKLSLQPQQGGTILGGGICPISAVGFSALGSIFYANGDVERGSLCEHIGNAIQTVFPDNASRSRILVIQNSLSLPRQGFPEQLEMAYRLCTDVADTDVSFWKLLENDRKQCFAVAKILFFYSHTPHFAGIFVCGSFIVCHVFYHSLHL